MKYCRLIVAAIAAVPTWGQKIIEQCKDRTPTNASEGTARDIRRVGGGEGGGTCQDICSARTTHRINLDSFILYGRRFTRIRNRQYKQLQRLFCERWIHSVFALPRYLLSASSCMIYCCIADRVLDRTQKLWERCALRRRMPPTLGLQDRRIEYTHGTRHVHR